MIISGHHFARFEEACTPVPRLVGMASGRILELGPGSGNQLSRFNLSSATRIYGIEPNEELCKLLRGEVIDKHGIADVYVLIQAALEDEETLKSWGINAGSVDTIVCMQVLCSVVDARAAARIIHRPLKPGGQLIFWEHVESNDTLTRLVQSKLVLALSQEVYAG